MFVVDDAQTTPIGKPTALWLTAIHQFRITQEQAEFNLLSTYSAPREATMSSSRNLRACMVCSVVKTHTEFIRSGCPNCESFLQLQNSPDTVAECTSAVFDSLIAITDPATSWVAKWQRLSTYLPGVYAVKVVGTLPDEVLSVLEDNNIRYVPRDGSAGDEDFAG